jgi:hypothetical protein
MGDARQAHDAEAPTGGTQLRGVNGAIAHDSEE